MVSRQSPPSTKADVFVYESSLNNSGRSNQDQVGPNPTGSTKRTARACVRCRKQKLKCDSYRPCALCVRANVACVSRPESLAEGKKSELIQLAPSQSTPQNGHGNYTATSVGLPSMASLTESMSIGLPHPQNSMISSDMHDQPPPMKLRRLLYPEPSRGEASFSSDTPPHPLSYGPPRSNLGVSTFETEPRPSSFSLPSPRPIASLLSSDVHNRPFQFPDKTASATPDPSTVNTLESSAPLSSQASVASVIDTNSVVLKPASSPISRIRSSVTPSNSTISELERVSSLIWTHSRPTTASLMRHLPPRPVMDYAIAVYFNTVHWFLLAIHEGDFLERYNLLMDAYESDPTKVSDSDEDFTFLHVLMLVIALGGRYIVTHPARRKKVAKMYQDVQAGTVDSATEIDKIMSQLVYVTRTHLLDSLSCCTLSTVQACILLGSYYLYHSDPNLAWSIFGSGLKSAQALGLHRDAAGVKGEKSQLRRRIFWSLYNYDRFAAMCYGRPLGIDDSDCDVGLPNEDNAYPPHDRSSYLMIEDDLKLSQPFSSATHRNPPTLLTYQVCKLQFYIILGEIISVLYKQGLKGCAKHVRQFEEIAVFEPEAVSTTPIASIEDLLPVIQRLEAKLRNWYEAVPDVLKLGEYDDQDVNYVASPSVDDEEEDNIIIPDRDDKVSELVSVRQRRSRIKRDTFGMQALLLQVAYDNAIIILHRPLLAFRHQSRSPGGSDPFAQSANACWQAAMRTSKIAGHAAFSKIQTSHGVGYVGIQLFTAGVLLSVFGSSEPLSQRALESKRGLSRIIQMQKSLKLKILVGNQGFRILESLARVVVQKEMEKILSGGPYADNINRHGIPASDKRYDETKGGSEGGAGPGKDDDDRSAAVVLTRLSYHLNGSTSFSDPNALAAYNAQFPHHKEIVENQSFNETLLNLERGNVY
ncbi:fungal-specific transcription factor domain-containing protein [Lipomyces arxii]|uniref:fungal-specific transcription factor domain-containing protein n=1 Tax=Lipomyces arxii TaxID=56418 RepID=UPI0034CD66D2